MNKQTVVFAAVSLVSALIGAFSTTLFSTPADARSLAAHGRATIVQIAPVTSSLPISSVWLFRLWSDGTTDLVTVLTGLQETCDAPNPPEVCLRAIIPADLATPSDLNLDGSVDAADLSILLGDWSARPGVN